MPSAPLSLPFPPGAPRGSDWGPEATHAVRDGPSTGRPFALGGGPSWGRAGTDPWPLSQGALRREWSGSSQARAAQAARCGREPRTGGLQPPHLPELLREPVTPPCGHNFCPSAWAPLAAPRSGRRRRPSGRHGALPAVPGTLPDGLQLRKNHTPSELLQLRQGSGPGPGPGPGLYLAGPGPGPGPGFLESATPSAPPSALEPAGPAP